MEQHFCYAKVVACGRVIEREWGNPSKVPPSHSPFLAMCGSADNKTCERRFCRVLINYIRATFLEATTSTPVPQTFCSTTSPMAAGACTITVRRARATS